MSNGCPAHYWPGAEVHPTRPRTLLGFAAVGAAVGWGGIQVLGTVTGRIVAIPWAASIGLWVLALGVLVWAVLSRPRLGRVSAGSTRAMPPLVAARTAALAMAASRTGALIGGLYLGAVLGLVGVAQTPSGSSSLAAAATAAAACAVLTASALWLEYLCRLKDDDPR